MRICLLLAVCFLICGAHAEEAMKRPRVIATTDGEIDDRCSMVRFLLYTNEWDIRGIIHSSSTFHWKGDENHPEKDWEPVEWLDRQIDAYAEVYPNLVQHDAGYPSPDYLRSQVFVGNIGYEGDMDKPTPGSDRIVEVLLEDDDSPVWLQAWGGANTIARALKTIQEEHPAQVDAVAKKIRIFMIAEQDNTFATYIRPEWPGIQVILSDWPAFEVIAYPWRKILPEDVRAYFDRDWMTTNILENHGALCAMYEHKEGRFRSEGDTPSFLHVINTGLRSNMNPSYGGWGGQFKPKDGYWISIDKRGDGIHSIVRWAKDFQNDWAARADWCVKDVASANHAPVAALAHDIALKAKQGDIVSLDASPSADPDGDTLAFKWWHYTAADSYKGTAPLQSDGPKAQFAVPGDAKPGDTIHLVCTVKDDGEPQLTRYTRVIIEVEG